MTTDRSERHPVDRLAEEFVARYRQGERPSIAEYARLYPDLAAELEQLLTALILMEEHGPGAVAARSDSDAGSPGTDGRIPDRLGEYRILREIGRGGMGVVYEAVQESLGRHVALKVLPAAALLDATRLKRFQREVQAAARLHHTNIVPVFGVSESDGVRYYSMQFIPGRGIDTVIDEVRQLKDVPGSRTPAVEGGEDGRSGEGNTVSAALSTESDSPRYYRSVARLGEQVAEALAHAHRQGILHRDIKPANLLLDAQGTVWVTDFGLATGEGMEELTNTGDVVGTLRYMAPERLEGNGDARADVYSLGLTLYELLTLRPAFDAPDRAALVRQIADANPPRPRKLDPRIPRDLETIVLKACAREPSKRYADAGELADDLRRFLGNRPIEARRTPWWEQAWRWCRRNPGISTASAAALAALLIGLGVSLWQWRRADDSARQAEANATQAETGFELAFQAVDQMLERVGFVQLEAEPLMDQTRRALLEDAVRFYQDLLRGREGESRARFAMARANFRLAMIHAWFRDLEKVKQNQDQAFALVKDLRARDPGHADYRRLEANLCTHRAWLRVSSRQIADAEADYRRSLKIWEELIAEFPGRPEFMFDRANTLCRLGAILKWKSQYKEAESTYREAIALADSLPPTVSRRLEILADAHNSLSGVLDETGKLAERDESRRLALEFYERCGKDNPGPRQQHNMAKCLAERAHSLAREPATREQAEKMYGRSLAISERLAADFPDAPHMRDQLALTSNWFGLLQHAQGRSKEAEVAFERAVTLWKDLVAQFPDLPAHRVNYGNALHNQAMKLAERRDDQKARALFEEAIEHQETALESVPNPATALEFLGNHYRELVRLLIRTSQLEDAEKVIRRQLASAQRLGAADDGRSLPILAFQARSFENAGRVLEPRSKLLEAAEAYHDAAVRYRRLTAELPAKAEYASGLGLVLNDRALILSKQGNWSEMAPLLDEAIRSQEAAVRARPTERAYQQMLCNHHSVLARARVEVGEHAGILPAAISVRERFPAMVIDAYWAFLLVRCIPLAEKDSHLGPDERARLAGEYGEQAMTFLQAAQRKNPKSLSGIDSNPAFAPLRGRPDFQKLLATVPKSGKEPKSNPLDNPPPAR
jgi:serine/threonine protein kinase